MVAMDPALMTNTELQTDALLRRYDFELTATHRGMLGAYRVRVRRARWCGVLGVVIAAIVGLFSPADLLIALLLTGYLLGSTLAELIAPTRSATGAVRAASLTHREPSLLLPRWARMLPWVILAPLMVSPLLLIGDHPEGVTRFRHHPGFCMARATWFSTPTLVLTTLVAAAGLLCWRVTLVRLTRRRLPVDDPEAARLDLLTRALSARSVAGTAAALGLTLLAGLSALANPVLHSETCGPDLAVTPTYALYGQANLIANLGSLAFCAAIGIFFLSRLPRVNADTLRAAADAAP